MKISDKGLSFIKRFEGFEPKPYKCPAGVWTIGYGTTEGIGPDTPPVTEEEATALLEKDLNRRAEAIGRHLPQLSQNKVDAILSFCYNVGVKAFLDSTLCEVIRRDPENYLVIKNEFRRWNKVGGEVLPGLVRRREAEAEMYAKG